MNEEIYLIHIIPVRGFIIFQEKTFNLNRQLNLGPLQRTDDTEVAELKRSGFLQKHFKRVILTCPGI